MPADPRIATFLRAQRQAEARALAEEVEAWRNTPMERRGELVAAACALAAQQVDTAPDGDRMRLWQDPPHPSWPGALVRIRARHPHWRFSPEDAKRPPRPTSSARR